MTPAELASHARAGVRSMRRTYLALGLLLLALGLSGLAILAAVTLSGAAQPDDDMLPIGIITLVVAVLPGAWLAAVGLQRDDRHPLVQALHSRPERVRATGMAYRQSAMGYTKVVTVTLEDGSTHEIEVR